MLCVSPLISTVSIYTILAMERLNRHGATQCKAKTQWKTGSTFESCTNKQAISICSITRGIATRRSFLPKTSKNDLRRKSYTNPLNLAAWRLQSIVRGVPTIFHFIDLNMRCIRLSKLLTTVLAFVRSLIKYYVGDV